MGFKAAPDAAGVTSLGELGDATTLTGAVKLKEGANITLTRDDPNNALAIAGSAAPVYNAPNLGGKYDFLLDNLPSDSFGFLGIIPLWPYSFYLPPIGNKALLNIQANVSSLVRLLSLLELGEGVLAVTPANCGNSMPSRVVNGRYIYMPQGLSAAGVRGSAFYRYDLWTDTWTTLAAITTLNAAYRFNYSNGCLWDGGNYIIVIGAYDGSADRAIFFYYIPGDSWSEGVDAPTVIYPGSGVEGPIGDFIYVFRGQTTTTFYRYSISGNTWATLTPAPGAHVFPGLVQDPDNPDLLYALGGAEGIGRVHRYSISGDSWVTLTGTNIPGVIQGKGVFFTQPVPHILQYLRAGNRLWVYKV